MKAANAVLAFSIAAGLFNINAVANTIEKPQTLRVEMTSVISTDYTDTEEKTEIVRVYLHDEAVVREDGYLEIRGRSLENGMEEKVRWIFSPDGTPIGKRSYYTSTNSYSDTIYNIDLTLEDYLASLENVEKVEENTIYLGDGSTHELTLEENKIVEIKICSSDGSTQYIEQDKCGLLEKLSIYEAGESEPCLEIENTYVDFQLEE